jgi:hypothetical protein
MIDIANLSPAARSAAMRGGTDEWGLHANARTDVRYMEPVAPKSRKRCHCGCKMRATHYGRANGMTLTKGCEMKIRRWVRGGR